MARGRVDCRRTPIVLKGTVQQIRDSLLSGGVQRLLGPHPIDMSARQGFNTGHDSLYLSTQRLQSEFRVGGAAVDGENGQGSGGHSDPGLR